ncbi:hypothetical protein SAMN04487895_104284 [Paenibacillus sophorae]|uniref:Uncharacterized protein n=1 Tax=Paenibacillus sophorae TaxID=1333845 RepID=A0A1H8LCW4_9BACL|nr:hypothetical protein [Paenibacillus sophorae]QWU17332.1 hypothetical protein KP014_09365 [Paenibacillus sophorae]SEO03002.1 hypothetical protein SAMN04487895_104284 [Paenibacillus sophorae]
MSYKPVITNVTKASSNDKDGLYEFIIKLADGTECRAFYHRLPEWRMTNISRLLKTPCPICRKDFICKCMEAFTGELEDQMIGDNWIEKTTAE